MTSPDLAYRLKAILFPKRFEACAIVLSRCGLQSRIMKRVKPRREISKCPGFRPRRAHTLTACKTIIRFSVSQLKFIRSPISAKFSGNPISSEAPPAAAVPVPIPSRIRISGGFLGHISPNRSCVEFGGYRSRRQSHRAPRQAAQSSATCRCSQREVPLRIASRPPDLLVLSG